MIEAFARLGLGSIAGLIIVFCIFNFFWAILSAILANRYGRNPWSWFFLSGLWGLFGFLCLLVAGPLTSGNDTIAKILWCLVFLPVILFFLLLSFAGMTL